MRFVPLALLFLTLLLPAVGRAQGNPVVLELFTSQGCSSCPPADELLTELAKQPGVVALALHVDYWDYLGWRDSFASPAYTKRQRAYAKMAGRRSLFTPQMVVQGQDFLVGHDEQEILSKIGAHNSQPPPVALNLERKGDSLLISLTPRLVLRGPIDVHVVRFIPSYGVSIEAGENAGHDMTYSNIVTDWETVARWDGVEPLELRYDGYDGRPTAVIVQQGRVGPVLTAAMLD